MRYDFKRRTIWLADDIGKFERKTFRIKFFFHLSNCLWNEIDDNIRFLVTLIDG